MTSTHLSEEDTATYREALSELVAHTRNTMALERQLAISRESMLMAQGGHDALVRLFARKYGFDPTKGDKINGKGEIIREESPNGVEKEMVSG